LDKRVSFFVSEAPRRSTSLLGSLVFAIIFWCVLGGLTLAAGGSFVFLVRRGAVTPMDGALFVVPFMAWWALAVTNLRPKSLSNLVEPIGLYAFICACFVVRTFAVQTGTNRKRSLVALCLASAAALVVYVCVPGLPE
jgi:hypothetical protein